MYTGLYRTGGQVRLKGMIKQLSGKCRMKKAILMAIAKLVTGNCRASEPVVYGVLSGDTQSYLGFIIFFIVQF
jgi:cytoskeletal protein CcmA (bactofilin family)